MTWPESVCGAGLPLLRVGFFTHNRAFDLTKARRVLGYEPKWSHGNGIAVTIEWYRANGDV
jgi:nucleoside-diphosphate-sugar epimerase